MPVRDGVLEQTYTIHARPATVFRFFTDPVRFARWWACPGGGRATIEPRVGGSVRIEYQGGAAVMAGSVLEIDPDRRFVFSWGYERGPTPLAPGTSRVEITLREATEGTLLTLRHIGLPTTEQQTGHEAGWRHYMSVMAGECAADEFAQRLPRLMADYFEAWATEDAAARRQILDRCWDPEGEFRDAFSAVRGIDDLNSHIGNSRRHMPGMRLEASGPPQLCHGYARAAWRVVNHAGGGGGSGGAAAFSGMNFARLSPGGRIALLIGFWDKPGIA